MSESLAMWTHLKPRLWARSWKSGPGRSVKGVRRYRRRWASLISPQAPSRKTTTMIGASPPRGIEAFKTAHQKSAVADQTHNLPRWKGEFG